MLASSAEAARHGRARPTRSQLATWLFQALTGRAPETAGESVRQVRADVPPALAGLVDAALAGGGDDLEADRQWLGEITAAVGLGAATTLSDAPPEGATQARRARLGSPAVVLVVAVALAGLLALRPVEPGTDAVPPLGLNAEQAMLLQGLTERADATLRRDDFVASTAAFQRYYELAPRGDAGALLGGWTESRLAFARHLATDYSASEAYAAGALGTLDRGGLGDHPWRMVAHAMLGTALAQRGAFEEAAEAFVAALAVRERVLGLPPRTGPFTALVSALERIPADAEWDEDGLLDIFELVLGLDQWRVDSDGNGIPDADETAPDGWPHVVRFGLAQDATRVLGTAGTLDPAASGFWRSGDGSTLPASGGAIPALRLTSTSRLLYHAPFSSEQKRAAPLQGWRLFLRVRPEGGRVLALVDAMPALGPCRLSLSRDGHRLTVDLNGAGAALDLAGPDDFVLLELSYEPARRAVQLRHGARRLIEQRVAPGTAVSPWGLSFGVESDGGTAAAALAAVLFEIRF